MLHHRRFLTTLGEKLKTSIPKNAEAIVTPATTVFWFRRDLRLTDNAGLYYALKENQIVLPLFIFDTQILEKLEDKKDGRVGFIYQTIADLKAQLEEMGSTLMVLHGDPEEIFRIISPAAVYANDDGEPYAQRRDNTVRKILKQKGSVLKTFKDHVIFARDEVLKDDGKPYTIFTPYSRKWKSFYNASHINSYPSEKLFSSLVKTNPMPTASLEEIGFEETEMIFPSRIILKSVIEQYHKQRNFPALHGTTRLSIHLRFGTVSIRKLARLAWRTNEAWLNELIWRDFYHMILCHFPKVETKSFKPLYDNIEWRNNPEEFDAWCRGQTGYPIVDAGMRELNATGFMHNRVRMIVASFLTKHLLIDWRWGEAYFAGKLLDFDLAANNGGWQWAAGCGCDAAPYFRVFNPQLQTEKFDPTLAYVNKWVPEHNTADYPVAIVEHKFARDRALKVYRAALG